MGKINDLEDALMGVYDALAPIRDAKTKPLYVVAVLDVIKPLVKDIEKKNRKPDPDAVAETPPTASQAPTNTTQTAPADDQDDEAVKG